MPTFYYEKKFWEKGLKFIVGLDESGRGALAGPVVAAATLFRVKIRRSKLKTPNLLKKIRDSKKLSPKKREYLFKNLTSFALIEWGTGKVSEKVIDKINILEATKLAMKRSIQNLGKKSKILKRAIVRFKYPVDYLIVDGNFKLDLATPQKSIVKADQKVFSCALSSIVAKVTRDRIMQRYHKKYPQYGFSKHKGYPTKFHLKMLKKYGPCKIHRKTFRPVMACNVK